MHVSSFFLLLPKAIALKNFEFKGKEKKSRIFRARTNFPFQDKKNVPNITHRGLEEEKRNELKNV